MKFGNYLEKQAKEEWSTFYLDYKGLKDLIKESATEAATSGPTAFSPRTTSLSIARAGRKADASEERFFQKLEQEVRRAPGEKARAAGGGYRPGVTTGRGYQITRGQAAAAPGCCRRCRGPAAPRPAASSDHQPCPRRQRLRTCVRPLRTHSTRLHTPVHTDLTG